MYRHPIHIHNVVWKTVTSSLPCTKPSIYKLILPLFHTYIEKGKRKLPSPYSPRWFAKRFLHPSIVSAYDYVFVWDEDLDLTHFHGSRWEGGETRTTFFPPCKHSSTYLSLYSSTNVTLHSSTYLSLDSSIYWSTHSFIPFIALSIQLCNNGKQAVWLNVLYEWTQPNYTHTCVHSYVYECMHIHAYVSISHLRWSTHLYLDSYRH